MGESVGDVAARAAEEVITMGGLGGALIAAAILVMAAVIVLATIAFIKRNKK